jgi:hypothetical protein
MIHHFALLSIRVDYTIIRLSKFCNMVAGSLALGNMNLMATTDDDTPALQRDSSFEKGDVLKERRTTSNDHSSDAAKVSIDKDLEIDKDNTEDAAKSWERTITTPNKVIEQFGSSNEKSSNAAAIGGDGEGGDGGDAESNGGD